MNWQIAAAAQRDIQNILLQSRRQFGPRQMTAYAQRIDRGIELIAASPTPAGSIDRSDIAAGVRSFHRELTARRRHAAVHCLYYRIGELTDGSIGAIVLRVLHDRMEPRRRVVRSLSAFIEGPKR